ncbi:hypothetical protein CK503_14830 [Aliifodinibius salipaludis]|uniref:Uncharacterized protein n=1 Tax=Fodinibius salipaludis TaxID=2032627 RepID=A0A2A2G7G4_9BACT|nr:hypothetical protein CK503_14830 [Aliifodinibius salipaludis]
MIPDSTKAIIIVNAAGRFNSLEICISPSIYFINIINIDTTFRLNLQLEEICHLSIGDKSTSDYKDILAFSWM